MPFFFKYGFALCLGVKMQQNAEGALGVKKSEVLRKEET